MFNQVAHWVKYQVNFQYIKSYQDLLNGLKIIMHSRVPNSPDHIYVLFQSPYTNILFWFRSNFLNQVPISNNFWLYNNLTFPPGLWSLIFWDMPSICLSMPNLFCIIASVLEKLFSPRGSPYRNFILIWSMLALFISLFSWKCSSVS